MINVLEQNQTFVMIAGIFLMTVGYLQKSSRIANSQPNLKTSLDESSDRQKNTFVKATLWNLLFIVIMIRIPSVHSGLNFLFYLYMIGFLYALGLQDLLTYFIDWKKWWGWILCFLVAGGSLMKFDMAAIFYGLLFGLMVFPFVRQKKMGSADLVFIVLYTSLLGAERMLVCLMTAAVLGLLIGIGKIVMNSKNRLIPFVSCLNVGFLISYAYGYSIYFSSIQMLSFNF